MTLHGALKEAVGVDESTTASKSHSQVQRDSPLLLAPCSQHNDDHSRLGEFDGLAGPTFQLAPSHSAHLLMARSVGFCEDEGWKAKMCHAMCIKSGRELKNEFLDGTGEPQWASEEFMRISRDMCLADLRRERLPKHNPYIGNFHRGISVSNASFPTWDFQVERMFAHNPYVGRVTRGDPSLSFKKEWVATSKQRGEDAANAKLRGESALERRSSSGLARTSSLKMTNDVLDQVHGCAVPECQAQSTGEGDAFDTPSSSTSSEETQKTTCASGQNASAHERKRAASLSFQDILDFKSSKVPSTPALCGIQGLLPRQAGIRVMEKVAQGEFATVVLAINKKNHLGVWTDRRVKRKLFNGHTHLREGQRIVMKCIHKGGSEEEIKAIDREVMIHGALSHPNIATCHGFYEDARYVVMILDFIDGRELKQLLQTRRRLEEAEAAPLMLQAIRALSYLHSRGIVHRDISPRNLLVTADARLFLVDFGLVVALDADLSHVSIGAGTMGYLAPELLRDVQGGEGDAACCRRRERLLQVLGPWNDMWAIGCILYETVFGFHAFQPHELYRPGGAQLFFNHDENYGPVPSHPLQHLNTQLLSFCPRARLSAAAALQHAFFADAAARLPEEPKATAREMPVLSDMSVQEQEADALRTTMCVDEEVDRGGGGAAGGGGGGGGGGGHAGLERCSGRASA